MPAKMDDISLWAVYLYSHENMLICGAQIVRTHNTAGVRRTRNPRSVGKHEVRGAVCLSLRGLMRLHGAAVSAVERLIGADTAHFVSGFAPDGVPLNSRR